MSHHHPNRQLYKESHFILPILEPITYSPFEKNLLIEEQEQQNKEEEVSNKAICRTVTNEQQEHEKLEQKPTYQLAYNQEFEIIIGGENMYPLFIETNRNNDNLIVCSQECFLVIKIEEIENNYNDDGVEKNSKDNRNFLSSSQSEPKENIIKLGVYNKVVLDEPPNCLKATTNHVYLGMNDGKILCYDILRKTLTGISDDFTLPIMEIESISENEILAIDSIGNVKYVEFSHKTFLDKIIKTLINTKEISIVYKINKREKFKKLFQSVVSKKDDILGQSSTASTGNESNNQSVNEGQSLTGNINMPLPYSHNRISLPGEHLDELLTESEIKIIAIVRNNKLSILTCDEEYESLQEQLLFDGSEKQEEQEQEHNQQGKEEEKPPTIGMVEFGIGGFENSNNTHLLIVFSFGNRLKYFKGVLAEDIYEWMYISESVFDSKILDGKFISNNLILVAIEHDLSLINVTEKPEKIHTYNFAKFEYIDFFIKEEGLNFDRKLITKSLLRTINNNDNKKRSEFLCLEGKRLLTGKIDSWDDYLQKYVDEYKFNEAMIMSLKIYNRELKKLANINEKQEIRNKEMKQFFEKVALTYISYEIKKEHSNKIEMLKMCIDFLVKTECFQYLFTTIFEIVKSIGLEEKFLETIDIYIMKGHIKVMTEEIINLMTNWYKNRDEKYKLETMIQSFDLSLMEKSILLIICLREHLYQSMIYICIQHGDFISPILKLCGVYYTQKLNEQEKSKMTEILFFYLKECLLGHSTEFGNSQAYIEMLIQLINFLFIPNTLDMLVGISCKDTIKIVNMFFETKVMQFILENEGKFFIKKNDYVEMKIFEESCINEFKVYEKMLSTLIFIEDQNENKKKSAINGEQKEINHEKHEYEDLSFQVNTFLSYLILKNQFPFETKYKENAIFFFIEHSSLESSLFSAKFKALLNDKNEKEVESNAYFMRLMDSLMRSFEGKEEEKQKTLNLILNKLESSIPESSLLEGECYVLHELNRETEVLRTFLKMANEKIKMKVFDYLEFNMSENIDLTSEFINNLEILMTMNKQKTTSLLYQINHSFIIDPEIIITNLSSYPDEQLEYIEMILKLNTFEFSNSLSQQKRDKLSLVHLNIVVKHKSVKLDSYIQMMDYPLEEAFKICEEKSNKTAKAYILIKSGRNMEGLLLLCDLFLKKCDDIFGQMARKKSLPEEKISQLIDQLTKLLESCHKEFEMDSQRGEKIWSKCLKKIFTHLRISQNMRNESIPEPIKFILKKIVQKTLKKMFSQMSPEYFIEKFCKRFPQLPFSVFIIGFSEVFDKMEFYSKLQLLELELQQKDINRYVLNILKNALKSHSSRSECQICYEKLSFSNEKSWSIVTFSCGCIFHKQCVMKRKTPTNENVENIEKKQTNPVYHICMNNIEQYVELKGIKVENLKAEVHQEMEIKKRIMKLKDYETNQGLVFEVPSFNL